MHSGETEQRREIGRQAFTLFTNKEFAALELLAAKYRASKEKEANGVWKLAAVYNALEPKENAPDPIWQERLKQVKEWSKAKPDTAMSRIALARILTSYAWEARGSGWADKVKDENWTPFFNRLKSALVSLQEAKRLKDPCPVYWSSLQRVALGLQFEKNQYDSIFAQAIKEFPDYDYYYCARAYHLLPRWYGDEGEWESDLTKWADRVGGEAGDVLYARVFWSISCGTPSEISKILPNKKSSWERVDRGFGILLNQFPDSLGAKNQRACLAAMAGQREKARNYFLESQGQVELAQWSNKKNFEQFLDWTFER